MRRIAFASSVLATTIIVSPHAQRGGGQAPAQVFHTATQHISVNVIVTDTKDRVVTDLTKDDFVIVANDREQKVADFGYISIPPANRTVDLDAPTRPPADVAFNAETSQTSRAFVFVINDTSIPPSELYPLKQAMTAVLKTLSTDDQVAMVYTSRSDLSEDFTSDINRLIDSVNNRRAAVGMNLPFAGSSLMVVLRNVVATLSSSRHARRAVFLVGTSGCIPHPPNPDWSECLDLVHRAWKADVPFYVIDPRIFVNARANDMSIASPDDRATAVRAIADDRESMSTLASATGGRAMSGAANPAKAAADIVAENGSYYLLGFYPDPILNDGKFHDIKVTVKRPGLIVRGRRGYMAPATDTRPSTPNRDMIASLGAGLDDPSLPVRAFAAPLSAAPKGHTRTLVTVEIAYPVRDSTVPSASLRAGRALDDDVRVGILALTPDGKIKASFQRPIKITGTWLPAAHGNLVVNETIDLPTEKLSLRVGVTSRALKKTGTAHIWVDPPDFTNKKLQMSGIVSGTSAMALDAAMGLDTIRGIVPFQPTTSRTFSATETLRLFARLTWDSKPDNASVTIAITGAASPAPLHLTVNGQIAAGGHREGVLDTILPLASLAPGAYVLRVEATQPGAKPAIREVPFDVRK